MRGNYGMTPAGTSATPGAAAASGNVGGGGFARLLAGAAGGLGGIGQGMMTPDFREAFRLGGQGVTGALTKMDEREKQRQQYQRDRDEWTERRRLSQGSVPRPPNPVTDVSRPSGVTRI